MTKFTSLTLVEFAAEALLYEVVQPVLEGFEADGVDNLIDKGELEQQPCLVEADAALAHIEEGCIVELADGAAMGALDIMMEEAKRQGAGVIVTSIGKHMTLNYDTVLHL